MIYELERWFQEFVDYCEPRGGTYGMNLAAIKEMIARRDTAPEDSLTIVEPREDGSADIRAASAEEKAALEQEIAEWEKEVPSGT